MIDDDELYLPDSDRIVQVKPMHPKPMPTPDFPADPDFFAEQIIDYDAKLRKIATLWHHWPTPYFQDKSVNTLFSISDRVRAEHPDWDFDQCGIEAKRLFIDFMLRGEI